MKRFAPVSMTRDFVHAMYDDSKQVMILHTLFPHSRCSQYRFLPAQVLPTVRLSAN
jgi:hypothetical protein